MAGRDLADPTDVMGARRPSARWGRPSGDHDLRIEDVPFVTTDWSVAPATEQPGSSGCAISHTFEQGNIRVRLVEYTAGYLADHWCRRGHVVLVLDGELIVELDDGREMKLEAGMSFQVADDASAHRARTSTGARLFIVD
jgi:quercetin dioxygenase-like cupin family protein